VTNAFDGRLFPDPLGDIQRSARPPSLNWGGVLLLRGREGAGRGRKGTEKRRGWGKGQGSEGNGRGLPPLYLTSGYGPACAALQQNSSMQLTA